MKSDSFSDRIHSISKKLGSLELNNENSGNKELLSEIEDELRRLEDLADQENSRKIEKASEEIEEKEIDLENLVQNAFDGITINDVEGNYVFANQSAAEISGYTRQELLTLNVRDLSLSSEMEEIRNRSLATIRGKNSPEIFESKMHTKSGIIIPIEVAATRTIWQGSPCDMVFFRDITKRKKDEKLIKEKNKELRNLNAVKDKFFSIIAHDLKNPIHHLQGFSELMLCNLDSYDRERKKYFLELINSSARHTYSLLEDLLMWARAQSGKVPFNPEELSCRDIVYQNIEMMKPSAEYKNISIYSDISEDLTVFADFEMVSTVLRNLLSNAVKFTKKDKKVTVGYERCINQKILLYVADEGVGISKDAQAGLFELDKHQSTHGTQEEKGTGLGLIVSKEFVERNGGEIWVESEEGEGTTIYFTLPAKKQ